MQSTYSYSYDDASWGDLLTTVGDDDVAYDEIGNPTYIGYTSDGEISLFGLSGMMLLVLELVMMELLRY